MLRHAKSVISLFLAALVACGSEQAVDVDSDTSGDGIALGNEPDTLDPHRNEETSGADILRDLFEGLTMEIVDARIVPGAATIWTISDDGLVYTFSVCADARWPSGIFESNGTPTELRLSVSEYRRAI